MSAPIDWSLFDAIEETRRKQQAQEVILRYLACKAAGVEPPKEIRKKGKRLIIKYSQKGKDK